MFFMLFLASTEIGVLWIWEEEIFLCDIILFISKIVDICLGWGCVWLLLIWSVESYLLYLTECCVISMVSFFLNIYYFGSCWFNRSLSWYIFLGVYLIGNIFLFSPFLNLLFCPSCLYEGIVVYNGVALIWYT